jgi:hypothetical protein
MDERPAPPPEGQLLATALAATGMSIREASRRAGISYGRWRQITTGYQNVSPGSYARVRAPAKTLARMARVVGVTAGQLEDEGERPDAATVLRGFQHSTPQAADTETALRQKLDALPMSQQEKDGLLALFRGMRANGGEDRKRA